MNYLLDFFFGRTVTKDELGRLGGDAGVRPPAPPMPAGHVDNRGVMVTPEMWADYEEAAST
jgi:hypothetical protein